MASGPGSILAAGLPGGIRLQLPECPVTYLQFERLLQASGGHFLIQPDSVVTVAPDRVQDVQAAFMGAEVLPGKDRTDSGEDRGSEGNRVDRPRDHPLP